MAERLDGFAQTDCPAAQPRPTVRAGVAIGRSVGGITQCRLKRDELIAALFETREHGVERIRIQLAGVDEKNLIDLPAEQRLTHGLECVQRDVEMRLIGNADAARFRKIAVLQVLDINPGEHKVVVFHGHRRNLVTVLAEKREELIAHRDAWAGLIEGIAVVLGLLAVLRKQLADDHFSFDDRLLVGFEGCGNGKWPKP